jgi:Protein of unknown function (DUF1566)
MKLCTSLNSIPSTITTLVLVAVTISGCGANLDLGKSIEGGNPADLASANATAPVVIAPPVVTTPLVAPTGALLSYLTATSYEINDNFLTRTVSTPLGFNSSMNAYSIENKREQGSYSANTWSALPAEAFKLLGSDGLWHPFNQSQFKVTYEVETPSSAVVSVEDTNGAVIPGFALRFSLRSTDLSASLVQTWVNANFNINTTLAGAFPSQSTGFSSTLTFISDRYSLAIRDGAIRYQGVTTASSLTQAISFCATTCEIQTFRGMNARYLPLNTSGVGIVKLTDRQTSTALADAVWTRAQATVAGGTGVEVIMITFPESVVTSNTLNDGKYKIYAVNPTDGLVYHGWRIAPGTSEFTNRQVNLAAFDAWWAAQSAEAGVGGVGLLNDTGITQCSDYAFGFSGNSTLGLSCLLTFDPEGDPIPPRQDALFGRDAKATAGTLVKIGGGEGGFDFTKLDNAGNPLPESATSWACVRDNNTKLVWENKTSDGGLRDWNKTYTWYSSDSTTNGGEPGYNSTSENTQAYAAAVNATNLCGASDWRLPDQEELRSIVSYGRLIPSIDMTYFQNTKSSEYWSSTSFAVFLNFATYMSFYDGFNVYSFKANTHYVRLVRGI